MPKQRGKLSRDRTLQKLAKEVGGWCCAWRLMLVAAAGVSCSKRMMCCAAVGLCEASRVASRWCEQWQLQNALRGSSFTWSVLVQRSLFTWSVLVQWSLC